MLNTMTQKRILLAEDSCRDAEITLAALEAQNLGHEVAIVRDGAEALDYLYHRGDYSDVVHVRPLVVILDLNMPRVNGLEVLRQIKADPNLRSVPVAMLSSSREEMDLEQSYRLGANSYVVKPVSFQLFLKSVGQLVTFWLGLNVPAPCEPIAAMRP